MVVHAFNPKTRETEADRSKFEASLVYKASPRQSGLVTLRNHLKKNKRRKEKKNSRRPIKIEEKKT